MSVHCVIEKIFQQVYLLHNLGKGRRKQKRKHYCYEDFSAFNDGNLLSFCPFA